MPSVIVTGAGGFVGRAVVLELLNSGYDVYAIIRPQKELSITHSKLHILKCDVSDTRSLADLLPKIDYFAFIHLAWIGTSGPLRRDAETQLKNIKICINTLTLCKELGCRRFLGIGSIMENEAYEVLQTNGTEPSLSYFYGCAKLSAFLMSRLVAVSLGVDFLWAQITNAYGVGEDSPRLINTTIKKIIDGSELKFTEGKQNYDFVYIDDVARAIRLILERGKNNNKYVIGSSSPRPLREYLEIINKTIAKDMLFQFGAVSYTGVNLPLSMFDCRNTEEDTGFKAEINFEDGIRKVYDSMR